MALPPAFQGEYRSICALRVTYIHMQVELQMKTLHAIDISKRGMPLVHANAINES